MRIRIMITPVLQGSKPEDSPPSLDLDDESDTESVGDVMSGLVAQMEQLVKASEKIDGAVLSLYERAKAETVVWMQEPLRPNPAVKAWCAKHRLPETPTIDALFTAILAAAQSLDYESRMLTFRKLDADMLWQGQQRLSIYEVIAKVPTLFL
jgi:hypothetical protein